MLASATNRDLSQTEAWFRDTLLKLLGWSGALIVLLAGWTLGNEKEEFSIQACMAGHWGYHSCQRAIALAIGYPILMISWVFLVRWVRERCPEHDTIPSKLVVYGYVTAMTVFSLVVFLLLLF